MAERLLWKAAWGGFVSSWRWFGCHEKAYSLGLWTYSNFLVHGRALTLKGSLRGFVSSGRWFGCHEKAAAALKLTSAAPVLRWHTVVLESKLLLLPSFRVERIHFVNTWNQIYMAARTVHIYLLPWMFRLVYLIHLHRLEVKTGEVRIWHFFLRTIFWFLHLWREEKR